MDSARQTKRKRRNNWTPEAEKVLFVVWSRNIMGLRATRKNHPVFIKMSHEMNALGYPYSVIEIKTKVHNLCSRYRDEKKVMDETGTIPSWPLFQPVHKIYWRGKNKANLSDSDGSADESLPEPPADQSADAIDEDYVSDASDVDSVDEAVLNCFDTMNKNMLSLIQHTNEQNKKSIALHQEMVEIQKERNEILKKMLDVFSTKWRRSTAADTNSERKKKKLKLDKHKELPSANGDPNQSQASDSVYENSKIEMSPDVCSDNQDKDISPHKSKEEVNVVASNASDIKQN